VYGTPEVLPISKNNNLHETVSCNSFITKTATTDMTFDLTKQMMQLNQSQLSSNASTNAVNDSSKQVIGVHSTGIGAAEKCPLPLHINFVSQN